MSGTGILVVGPESSGTHYMVELLSKNAPGRTVLHRSLPITPVNDRRLHLWPDLERFCEENGLGMVVVCFRHPYASMRGQVRAGWTRNLEESRKHLAAAWTAIGRFISQTQRRCVVSTYESLATPQARRELLAILGLELVHDEPFVDGNAKYW